MRQPRHVRISRMHRHPGCGFDVYGMEGPPALLDVKTHGIDDAKGPRNDCADGSIIADVRPDELQR